MKKIILALVPFIFIACSAPKYTYYFDHYPSKKATALKSVDIEEKQIHVAMNAESTVETNSDNASISTAPLELTASVSNETFTQHPKQHMTTDVHDVALKRGNAGKRGMVKAIKDFIKSPDSVQEGGNKNGFAIAGFVCALVGLFVLWPLCVLGLIFSIIGLKSNLKGLAIAGLVLGIVGIVLVIAASANGTM